MMAAVRKAGPETADKTAARMVEEAARAGAGTITAAATTVAGITTAEDEGIKVAVRVRAEDAAVKELAVVEAAAWDQAADKARAEAVRAAVVDLAEAEALAAVVDRLEAEAVSSVEAAARGPAADLAAVGAAAMTAPA
jgi:hypothetical protein